VHATDLVLMRVMLGAIVDFTHDSEPQTRRRPFALLIDGLRARDEVTPLDAPALDSAQLEDAMGNWKPAR
jgi:hypothetical protein